MAEQAARDIETTHPPGEYVVLVSLEDEPAPVSSQIVLVKGD